MKLMLALVLTAWVASIGIFALAGADSFDLTMAMMVSGLVCALIAALFMVESE